VYERVRQVVPKLEEDRPLTPDVEGLAALIVREALA
jgi:histidine ammonia-lyase